jgi:hypothetical protein
MMITNFWFWAYQFRILIGPHTLNYEGCASAEIILLNFKSEIFEIFYNSVEGRKIFFKHYFFNIGHQRLTNDEYIAGENEFFGRLWSPG